MATVGIIANPAASKDIRRLVAQGRVVPDWEKVNIVRRVLIGLQSTGVTKVLAMPDSGNLCRRAADDADVELAVEMLPMSPHYTEGDTMRAAAAMAEQGVGCLVTPGRRRNQSRGGGRYQPGADSRDIDRNQQHFPGYGGGHSGRYRRRESWHRAGWTLRTRR